ncbi:unnamed protein product [Soboliphyme baturini]|uniref:Secreted protein n=1 Tax=Soboliphyme baturini TaxID=241478 RepID=A0A183IAN2_9BILA|nr:unnamed protein product [Soboliphyme baturini]
MMTRCRVHMIRETASVTRLGRQWMSLAPCRQGGFQTTPPFAVWVVIASFGSLTGNTTAERAAKSSVQTVRVSNVRYPTNNSTNQFVCVIVVLWSCSRSDRPWLSSFTLK